MRDSSIDRSEPTPRREEDWILKCNFVQNKWNHWTMMSPVVKPFEFGPAKVWPSHTVQPSCTLPTWLRAASEADLVPGTIL